MVTIGIWETKDERKQSTMNSENKDHRLKQLDIISQIILEKRNRIVSNRSHKINLQCEYL